MFKSKSFVIFFSKCGSGASRIENTLTIASETFIEKYWNDTRKFWIEIIFNLSVRHLTT